ncbi:MAG: hypothetical protein AAF441_09385 [Pseudomonadota bacterium]
MTLAPPDEKIRDHFLAWQCRIRQVAMRSGGGRPTEGMRPRVLLPQGEEVSAATTVLIVRKKPHESTDFFRFQVQKTNDPAQVYEKGLQYLQGTHFQKSRKFSDELTALFPANSSVAETLLPSGDCLLEFSQYSQRYRMLCSVREFSRESTAWQATYWHNHLFNPGLTDDSRVLGFKPDWKSAQADPAPT